MDEQNNLDIHVFSLHDEHYLFDSQSMFKQKITHPFYEVVKDKSFPLPKDRYTELVAVFGKAEIDKSICELNSHIKKKKINFYKKIESKQKTIPINSLDICVIQDCNMKCTYCYAHYGTYSEKLTSSKMDLTTAQKSVDFLLRQSKDSPYVKLTFFGGEPLLNFELIKDVIKYTNKRAKLANKKVIYDTVTNGVLLEKETCDFFVEHNVNVIVSLDGTKNINDKTKKYNNQSHYDVVTKNISPYVNKINFTSNTTTCKTNYKHISEIADHFYDLGINNISFLEIAAGGYDTSLYFTDEEKENSLLPEYEKAFKYSIENIKKHKKMIFMPYVTFLSRLFTNSRNFYGCTAGRSHLSIGSNGDIYPCHRLMDVKQFILGNVHDDSSFSPESLNMYHKASINNIEPCRTCFARFICSGGCMRGNFIANNTIEKADEHACMAMKKHLELAIAASFQMNKWHVLPLIFRLLKLVYGSPGYILKDNDKNLIQLMCRIPGMNYFISKFVG